MMGLREMTFARISRTSRRCISRIGLFRSALQQKARTPAGRSKGRFFFDKLISVLKTIAIGKPPHLNPLAMEACKHPRVRVLTREEDAEFVECLECGEVFDSHEFTDMDIEEKSELDTQKEAGAGSEA
ncbi:MAG: hypothetical protein ABI164_09550 [Acidobacteriaceae bacterium]